MFATRSPCVVGILQNQSANHHYCLFGVPTLMKLVNWWCQKKRIKLLINSILPLRLYFWSFIYILIFHTSSLPEKLSYNGRCQLVPVAHLTRTYQVWCMSNFFLLFIYFKIKFVKAILYHSLRNKANDLLL